MSALIELSQAVRVRRIDIGLTQTMLAKMSGLSRATVNQLENGTVKDLSLTRASRLLAVLGLAISITVPHPEQQKKNSSMPLAIAARTASVSFRRSLSAEQLRRAFTEGKVSAGFLPHIHTLLEEAPVSLLARVVEQLHEENGIERSELWGQMRLLAVKLKSIRQLWA
jgi:transcriptional regulator with XRE-family HTH domain